MSKSKVQMPKEIEKECHKAIHLAAAAAAAAGWLPIPMSDAVPITAAQIGMIISLGKVFDIRLSEAAAKSIVGVGIAQQSGRTVASNLLKISPVPGSKVLGGIIGAVTAATITETLGWIVADDFFRMSQGEEPKDIIGAADSLRGTFDGLRFSKEKNSNA